MIITIAGLRFESSPMVTFCLPWSLIQRGCGRTGQEPQRQPLLKLFVECKIIYPTDVYAKLQHLSLLFMNQMFVLNKDRERGIFYEIQALQNLVIMTFSVHVQLVDILNTVSFENLGKSAHLNLTFNALRPIADSVQLLDNVVISVERPQ